MATFQTFASDLKLATKGLDPDAINAELARFARAELARAISSGRGSPRYDKFVNGRHGAAEETVVAPGPILYVFSWWREVLTAALYLAEQHSPVLTGRYRTGHFLMTAGRNVQPTSDIPTDATVMLTNRSPYSRKIHVGAMQMKVPPGVYEKVRQALRRQFDFIDAQVRMINLPQPYRLKEDGGRQGRREGEPLTYPAVVMRMMD